MPDIVEQTNTPTQPTQPAPPKNQSESKKAMNGIQGGLAFSIVLGIFTYLMYGAYQYLFGKVLFWTLLILTIIGILIAVSCLIDWKTAKKMEQIEEEAKREERELSEIGPDKRVLRAEKLYKMNQKDLMRYYDANPGPDKISFRTRKHYDHIGLTHRAGKLVLIHICRCRQIIIDYWKR